MLEVRVLLCDNHLLAIDKPAGMLSQSDRTGDEDAVSWARAYIRRRFDKPGNVYATAVHRLDRPVAGVLLLARTSKAAARLSAAFRERRVTKRYRAVVCGVPAADAGELVDHLARRYDAERGVRALRVGPDDPEGKPCRTRWRVCERAADSALLELEPLTGRPHQLRCQLAGAGWPIRFDTKYGAPTAAPDRSIALRSAELAFEHPTRREPLTITAEPPAGWPWPAR